MTEASHRAYAARRAPRPWHLWVLGGVMALWQFVPTMDFILIYLVGHAWLAMTMTEEQIRMFEASPGWIMVVSAFNVWPYTFGLILMFMRSGSAACLFALGAAAMLPLWIYNYVITSHGVEYGFWNGFMWLFGLTIQGIIGFLYVRAMTKRGVMS